MRPRSKLRLCGADADVSSFAETTLPGGYLMVTDRAEMIVAAIGVRMLRPSQMDDLKAAAEPVIYVPWSARVSQVFDLLVEEDRAVAVVVNEFGEAVGALSIDDILRGVLAPRRGDEETPGEGLAIQETGDDEFLVLGSVSLRKLCKRLGIEATDESMVVTVGGFIQRHNERLPRVGDSARLGRFELTVKEESEDGIWIELRPSADQQGATR